MKRLKDGTDVEDPRLDRLVSFDDRSRNFPITAALELYDKKPRNYSWRMNKPVLNQGNEGACVGFGISHELAARPSEVSGLDFNSALNLYYEAQKIDQWPGGDYPGASPQMSGTSVLAGMKIAKGMGYFDEYRFGFGLKDLILGVGWNGPAVMGTRWYEDMYTPSTCCQRIYPTGGPVGGHCYLVIEVDIDKRMFTILNSWGLSWGLNGRARISFEDMDFLLQNGGEVAFAMKRHTTI